MHISSSDKLKNAQSFDVKNVTPVHPIVPSRYKAVNILFLDCSVNADRF